MINRKAYEMFLNSHTNKEKTQDKTTKLPRVESPVNHKINRSHTPSRDLKVAGSKTGSITEQAALGITN